MELTEFEEFYHGGYNQCFKTGYYSGTVYDYDIQNCYPTALLAFEEVDWTKRKRIYRANDLKLIRHSA